MAIKWEIKTAMSVLAVVVAVAAATAVYLTKCPKLSSAFIYEHL